MYQKLKQMFKLSDNGISHKEKFRLALPGPVLSIGSVLIHNVFIKYYTDVVGLDAKYVGLVYIIYNIWNAINDPLLGTLIDKMKYRKNRGKYAYIMKVTVPFMVLSSFAMALSSPSWDDWIIFLIYTVELFIYDTAATAYSVAYSSYILISAPSREERVDVGIIQTYISYVLSFFVTMIPSMLLIGGGKREYILPVFTAVILLECLFYWFSLRGIKDNEELYQTLNTQELDTKLLRKEVWEIVKTRQFISYVLYSIITLGPARFYFTPYLYYMDHVMKSEGLTATLIDAGASVIALALLTWIGNIVKNYGVKKSIYIGTIPAVIGFGGMFLARNLLEVSIAYTFVVFTVNYFSTCTSPMGSLMIDENERVTGTRKTGLYSGIFSLCITAFAGFQTVVFTSVIAAFGYDGTLASQSANAVLGIRVATGLVPMVAVLLGLIPMYFYPFSKQKEDEISQFSLNARKGLIPVKEEVE